MKTKLLLICSLLFFFGSTWAAPASSTQPLDKIVAVVNSDIITESALNHQINLVKEQIQSSGAPMPDPSQLRKQVLDQLIDEKMLLLLAKRNNITITDAQLNEALAGIAARNHLTMDQFKLAVQKQGMSYPAFRDQIHKQMLMQSVEEHALGPSLQITPEEVKAFMKQQPTTNAQYQLIDYLLSPTAAKEPQAVLTQLKQKNATPANVTVNPLGWRNLNDLPEIFAQKVVNMKVNEIAGPIQAPNGIHFIKVAGIKSSGPALTEQQARQLLLQKKFAEKAKPWLQQLRATAYIKIMQ